jgi:hypothetical protein
MIKSVKPDVKKIDDEAIDAIDCPGYNSYIINIMIAI